MKRRAILSVAILILGAAPALGESVFDGSLPPPPRFAAGPAAGAAIPTNGAASAAAAQEAPAKPDIGVAMRSFLVPGLAQQRLGRTTRARVFYGLEALTWIAAGSFLYAGYSREQSYKDYAVVFAGIQGTDRPDEYWEHIGEYLSSDGVGGYNEIVRRDARDYYYPDVAAMNDYYRTNAYEGIDAWRWRSASQFYQYGHLRDDSRFAYRYAIYSVFFAAALRVVSVADAVRLVRLESRPAQEPGGGASLGIEPTAGGMALCVRRSF